MKNIASFNIDHTKLLTGLYVSREDAVGDSVVTTFDIRVCKPNTSYVMSTGAMHTIEHIIATYLRNHSLCGDRVVYFGPMGCRTGFYLILAGKYSSADVLPIVLECFEFVANFDGAIPGASAVECGNYLDMDLAKAKAIAEEYTNVLKNITYDRLVYPN